MATLSSTPALLLGLLALLAGAADAAQAATRGYYQALSANPNHKLMLQLVDSSALYKGLLSSTSLPLTVFAPTDSAFRAAAKKYGVSPEAAMKSPALLQAMLMYHVVPGSPVTGSTLRKGKHTLKTMYKGLTLTVTNGVDKVTGVPVTWINSAGPGVRVVKFDQMVASPITGQTIGVIHDIGGVLLFDKDPKKMLSV